MSAKVPSGPPSPSLADSSLEVRQILRDQAGHALTRQNTRSRRMQQSKVQLYSSE